MLFIVPLFLFAAAPLRCTSLDRDTAYAFVKNVADDAVAYESIIKEHLCIDKTKPEVTAKKADLLTMQLKALREALKEGPWAIKTYLEIPAKEQNIQIDAKEKQHIYALTSGNKLICFIWVKDGKIASFSTMDKGGTRIFLEICK